MPKKYRYGEIIIKEGEMMNALFFLSTGRVRVINFYILIIINQFLLACEKIT